MKRSEIGVAVERQKVILSGQRRLTEVDQQKQVHQMELSRGPFRRTVTLPFKPDADKLRIRCQDGILVILVDKPGDKEK